MNARADGNGNHDREAHAPTPSVARFRAAEASAGSSQTPREATLEQLGTRYAERLGELARCNQGLARLVAVRVERPWTDTEHDTYLRLRRSRAKLDQRVMHVQQAFERARRRVRDLGSTS